MHDESKIEMKISEETKGLKELCEKLEKLACHSFENGMDKVETEEAGQVIDMIKDLCEAKEKVVKACYFKSIIKAMEKEEEEDKKEKELYGRMGYRGRDSRGRFVHRSGRGRSTSMGYTNPLWHIMPEMDDMYDDDYMDMIPENYRMGYSGGRGGNYGGGNHVGSGNYGGQSGNTGRYGYDDGMGYSRDGRRETSRHGETYDRYRDSRRHYTEAKDMESKRKMDESMKEYTEDIANNVREMWKDADPQLRQTMKADLTRMVQQLQ